MDDLDPRTAGLESQLDRLDEKDDVSEEPAPTANGTFDSDPEGFGFHLDDPDHAVDPLVDAVETHDDAVIEACDELVEAFNSRDLEALLEVVAPDGEAPGLLGWDRDNLPAAIIDLWDRRPTSRLTRGFLEGEVTGILWEHDGTDWWRVAAVSINDVRDGRVGVLEFVDDAAVVEKLNCDAPDDDLEEGERWEEWTEGTG